MFTKNTDVENIKTKYATMNPESMSIGDKFYIPTHLWENKWETRVWKVTEVRSDCVLAMPTFMPNTIHHFETGCVYWDDWRECEKECKERMK